MLRTYLELASEALEHNFLLDRDQLAELPLTTVPKPPVGLADVDAVLDRIGLVREAIGLSTSRIRQLPTAQLSLAALEVTPPPLVDAWGSGLGDRIASHSVLAAGDASVSAQSSIADLALQSANVYGAGSRVYFRGVSRSFGVDQTQNAPVVLAGQPLPDYLLETLALPAGGRSTSTLRRGADFGLGADQVPSYAGSIRTELICQSGPRRGLIQGTVGENSQRRVSLSAAAVLIPEVLDGCVDLSAASGAVPLFSLGETAQRQENQSLQTQITWTPLAYPNLAAEFSLVRLVQDLDERNPQLSLDTPLDFSEIEPQGLRVTRSEGNLLSAALYGDGKDFRWGLQVGVLDGDLRSSETTIPLLNGIDLADTRYQAGLKSLLDAGAAGTFGVSAGLARHRSRSHILSSTKLGDSSLFRLTGSAILSTRNLSSTANQHRYAALRYEVERGSWQFSFTNRYDDYRIDQSLGSQISFDFSSDCAVGFGDNGGIPCSDFFDHNSTNGTDRPLRSRSGSWTRQVALTRSFSPSLSAALQAYEGFRPGGSIIGEQSGTVAAIPYSEELSRTLEGRLSFQPKTESHLSVVVFATGYRDQQINPTAAQQEPTRPVILNSGRSKSRGAELEGRWALGAKDLVAWSVGYLSTEYVNYVPIEFGFNGLDVSGNQFPGAPRWSGSAQWRREYSETFSSRVVLMAADEAFADARNLANARSPGFARLDASLTARRDNLSATVFVENLTNERYLETTLNDQSFRSVLRPARGRSIGITLQLAF